MLWVHIVNHLQVFRIRRLTRWFLPSKLFCYSKQISLLLFCILLLCTVPRLVYYCPCVLIHVRYFIIIVSARVLGRFWKLNLFLVVMICLLMRFKGQWVQSILSQWPFIVWSALHFIFCVFANTSACACSIYNTCVPSINFGYGVVCLGCHLFMSLCEVKCTGFFLYLSIQCSDV